MLAKTNLSLLIAKIYRQVVCKGHLQLVFNMHECSFIFEMSAWFAIGKGEEYLMSYRSV